MKSQMSSFDIAAAVRELQQCVGLRAEKFFLLGHRDMFFRLSGAGEKRTVTVNLDRGLWLEEGWRNAEDREPPMFAMLMRKHLAGAELVGVRQHGFDRIAVFEFGTRPGVQLVAELFGSGNLILVKEGRIIQPLTSKSWKARDVKSGRDYSFPPESADPFSLDMGSLAGILGKSGKDLVRCLATEVNLGGTYAEEACLRLGLAKSSKASAVSASDTGKLLDVIREFGAQLGSPRPTVVLDAEGAPLDLVPFPLSLHSGLKAKEFGTFSEAAAEYFRSLQPASTAPGKSQRQVQLERQLKAQEEAVAELESQAAEFQRLGDAVYADYAALEALLSRVRGILSSGNWQAVKRDVLALEGVTGFEPAAGAVSVRVSGGTEAKLDVRLDINGNASALYERAKKARLKAQGAESAVAETRRLLAGAAKAQAREGSSDKRPSRKFWFDRFRWFISSEGFLVVGGRDTRSNDQVVKKHLQDGDLYAHADANGAPSVVIKDGRKAGQATLEQACIFAVAFSRAWKSRLASGSAYWVKPDQVSKTPEPGEFVPKGAFIIRGRRNYSKKLEIRLAIGLVKVEGHGKPMCGPVDAVSALASEYYILEPGEEKRSGFAKRISDEYRVPIEEIDRALPPGDLAVTKPTGR